MSDITNGKPRLKYESPPPAKYDLDHGWFWRSKFSESESLIVTNIIVNALRGVQRCEAYLDLRLHIESILEYR